MSGAALLDPGIGDVRVGWAAERAAGPNTGIEAEPDVSAGTSRVLSLRSTLAAKYPDAMPLVCRTTGTVGTGIAALDGWFPQGGLPRGRLSVWTPGGGSTAVLRSVCAQAASRGERSAWVDGAGVATAEFWRPGVLLLRPRGGVEALECAQELACSGGFAVVVLAGAGRGISRAAVRLSRSARSGGSALVVLGQSLPLAAIRIRSRLMPASFEWRCDPFGAPAEVRWAAIEVSAEMMGWSGRTRFRLPVLSHACRLALEPVLPDRRGVISRWEPGVSKSASNTLPVPNPGGSREERERDGSSRSPGTDKARPAAHGGADRSLDGKVPAAA